MADKIKTIKGGYDKKLYGSPVYRSWSNMKTRCYNKSVKDYSGYGGRGITVCDKWLSFKGFYEDMGGLFKEGLSIERIDNYGNYCKKNCRWATPKEQANNTRNIEHADKYSFNGKTMTVRQWAEETGINRTTLGMRLQTYHWPIEVALNQQVQ